MNTPSALRGPSPPARRVPSRLLLVAALIGMSLVGCASTSPAYHQYFMRGQVLSVGSESLVVCLGERDGARAGQELSIVRHVQQPAASKAAGPGYRRVTIGKARISLVFDEHYASARILDGRP